MPEKLDIALSHPYEEHVAGARVEMDEATARMLLDSHRAVPATIRAANAAGLDPSTAATAKGKE